MLDVGFWELLVIAVVALLVLGPERLPEVAKQAAFFVRKARQGMYRLRNEMRSEMADTPFADLQEAKQEMADFKNDIKQFGNELADSAEEKVNADSQLADSQSAESESQVLETPESEAPEMVELSEEQKAQQSLSNESITEEHLVEEQIIEEQLAEQKQQAAKSKASKKARKKTDND